MDICPLCAERVVVVNQPRPEGRPERAECMGRPGQHVFAVLNKGNTDWPRYRLGHELTAPLSRSWAASAVHEPSRRSKEQRGVS